MIPIFKTLFTLSYTQVGLITGVGLFVSLVVQLVVGRIADGKNFLTLLSLGILLTSSGLLLLSISFDFLSLFIFIVFIRFATSFFHPIGVGLISRTFKLSKLDWAMGIQSGCANVGAFVATATTLFLTEYAYWQFPLFLWTILGICGLFIGITLSVNLRESLTKVKIHTSKQSFKEAVFEGITLLKSIKILAPAFMISGASFGVIITYLPLLLVERTTLTLPEIGILIAIWIGIGAIVAFFYGTITIKMGRKNIIIFSYLTIGIIGFFITIITNIFLLLCLIVFLGVAVFLTFPALASFISEVTHQTVEGKTFGLIFTLQLGGGTMLLFIGGIVSDLFGIWMPFLLLGILSILYTTLLLILYTTPYAVAVK
jgi:FSR family fosmidomycin resistance protein-like MFS transporter